MARKLTKVVETRFQLVLNGGLKVIRFAKLPPSHRFAIPIAPEILKALLLRIHPLSKPADLR
jgi:hypothetical protein